MSKDSPTKSLILISWDSFEKLFLRTLVANSLFPCSALKRSLRSLWNLKILVWAFSSIRSRSPTQSGNLFTIEWKVRMWLLSWLFYTICPPSLYAMINIFIIRVPIFICNLVSSIAISLLISIPLTIWFIMFLRYMNFDNKVAFDIIFLFILSDAWSLSLLYIFLRILSLTSGIGRRR